MSSLRAKTQGEVGLFTFPPYIVVTITCTQTCCVRTVTQPATSSTTVNGARECYADGYSSSHHLTCSIDHVHFTREGAVSTMKGCCTSY
jgi:hypothetical protein